MKSILKKTTLNSLSLWLTSYIVAGLVIKGGIATIIIGGFVLFLLQSLLKPILQTITLPLNLLTLGFFEWIINIATLYLLTILVTGISVVAFTFPGANVFGFILPKMEFNQFLAFIAVTVLLTVIQKLIKWLL